MAFKSNMLLRQKMKSKRSATINKKFNSIKDELLISVRGAEFAEHKDETDMVDVIQSNEIEDPENEVEYVTVILANEETTESDDDHVEMVEESSEMDAIHEEEYIVTEESIDEIPKMSIKKHRSRRRTKDAESRSLTCQECGKTLSNFSSFKYHMQLHSEDTPFLCRLI